MGVKQIKKLIWYTKNIGSYSKLYTYAALIVTIYSCRLIT